ncbi:MAG: hypothetical protein GY801_14660 [bacterium]|nr:hypothetical protein [bacterium]
MTDENNQTKQPLAIGQSDFREFRKAGAYYVDKSLLIRCCAGSYWKS